MVHAPGYPTDAPWVAVNFFFVLQDPLTNLKVPVAVSAVLNLPASVSLPSFLPTTFFTLPVKLNLPFFTAIFFFESRGTALHLKPAPPVTSVIFPFLTVREMSWPP